MRIVVVGPCASGKTTLVSRLRSLGLDAHNVAQEHSGIKKLWRKKQPDVVVMLEASLPVIRRRRSVPWGEERLAAQRERLSDAREHADLFIQTDPLTREEVAERVLDFIAGRADDGSNDGESAARP
jgi:broad-specificity NMP kinase